MGLALTIALSLSAASGSTVLAVFPIEDKTGRLDEGSRKTLDDYLTAKIGNLPGISIVPTAEIKQRIQEQQAESYKACYDEACQIEIGKEAAANKSVATRVAAIGEDCLVSSYMFDLGRATTDATATVRSKCDPQSLLRALDDVVSRFREVIVASQTASGVAFGGLKITSDPVGAEIFLDNARTGLWTPAELKSVTAGMHRLSLETEEAKIEGIVTIEASKTASVSLKLKPRPCVLAISTDPPGAKITIAQKEVGTAPLTVQVQPGLQEISALGADGRTGRATVFAKPSHAPREISIALGGVATIETPEEKGLGYAWLIGGGVMLGAGVVLDAAPGSARDHHLGALDFVPLGLYIAGTVAAAIGVIPAL